MADYVIDTNVWVTCDKTIQDIQTLAELDCIESCKNWLRTFIGSEDRLILDCYYLILKEYRRNISPQGLARQWLNKLETVPRDRLVELSVELENKDCVRVSPPLRVALDPSDHKFAAVALAHNPKPPIIDASDTDWTRAQQALAALGIQVQELCPDVIQEELARKRR